MPFVKGETGNPGGVYSAKPMREALELELNEERLIEGRKTKRMRVVARKLIDKAEGGDIESVKEIFDRMDGKLSIKAEGLGANGAFIVQIVYPSKDEA